jgi:riboflavin transporter FmnP
MHSNTKKLAFAAILSALGAVMLLIGVLIPTLDLTACALASLVVMIALIELGFGYGAMTYAVTAVLAFLIGGIGQISIYYLLLFGLYPIIKILAEKLPKAWQWVLKFGFCNVMFCVVLLLLYFVFNLFEAITFGIWYFAVLIVVGNAIFLLYDIALSRLSAVYFARFHDRFPRL